MKEQFSYVQCSSVRLLASELKLKGEVMGRSIIPIGAAMSEVKEFFSGEIPFVAAFTILATHTWLIDQRVGVHREKNIIGISRSDSHYYFYLTIRGTEEIYNKKETRRRACGLDLVTNS